MVWFRLYKHSLVYLSLKDFQRKLKHARRLVVVGNGGIATELV